MAARNVEEHPTVSLRDVEEAVRRTQSGHCCDVTITLTIPVGSSTPVLFWVTARAQPRLVSKLTIKAPIAEAHRWPCPEHKTLAGLMWNLMWKLERKLDQIGHVPAEQATFDWAE